MIFLIQKNQSLQHLILNKIVNINQDYKDQNHKKEKEIKVMIYLDLNHNNR